jgi:hypothetical protein
MNSSRSIADSHTKGQTKGRRKHSNISSGTVRIFHTLEEYLLLNAKIRQIFTEKLSCQLHNHLEHKTEQNVSGVN